jgi:DNA processing protein
VGTTLFLAGDSGLLLRVFVGVVGTRRPSKEGLALAGAIAGSLARAEIVVASGLARGIDAAAHRGALAAGGRTVAILGTPLGRAYPAEHRALQATLAREHLVVSPFAPGTPVTRGNFPRRDRVLAALCTAIVVIEAADGSGTLHTVAEAMRLGRVVVLAAPVLAARCAWSERLLREGKAVRLDEARNVVEVVRRASAEYGRGKGTAR